MILRALGSSPAAIHWGAQIYSLGTLAVVFALGRRLFSPLAGLAAAAFAALLGADHSLLANAANTETFMILPLAGALLATLVAVERDAARWALAAGALSMAAVLFKQVAVTNLVFCALWIVRSARRKGALASAFAAGGALALLPVLAYFALAGAWDAFLDATVGHNLRYSSRVGLAEYPGLFWFSFRKILGSFWPIGILALIGAARRGGDVGGTSRPADGGGAGEGGAPRPDAVAIVGAWGLFAFLGVAMGGYFREHYFLQMAPAVALLAGRGVEALPAPSRWRPSGRKVALWAAAAAIALTILASPWYYLRRGPEEKCRRIYGDNPFPESLLVGRYLAERTRPEDTIFVFGSEPQILAYAGRRSASRYIFVYPLMGPFEDARARQGVVLEDLEQNRPRYIVTVFVPNSFLFSETTHTEVFRGIEGLLASSYRVVAATPYRWVSPHPFIAGETLLGIWNATPMTFGGPTWASMVIWERAEA